MTNITLNCVLPDTAEAWSFRAPQRQRARQAFAALAFGLGLVGVGSMAQADVLLPQQNPLRGNSDATRTALATPAARAQNKIAAASLTPTSPAEVAHNARYDAAVRPLLNLKVSASDLTNLKAAMAAVDKRREADALSLRDQIADPAARKLVDWGRLRDGYGTPRELKAFLDANPDWPNRWLLHQRLEEKLFDQGGSVAEVTSYLGGDTPETGIGTAALALAYRQAGDTAKARVLAARAWRVEDIAANMEGPFLKRLGDLLTPADHKWRLDRFLLDAPRWNSEKKAQAKIIRRIIPLLPEREQETARTRLGVFLGDKSAAARIAKMSNDGTTDWGLMFHKLQVMRRADQLSAAANIFARAPREAAKTVDPDAWWKERRAHAYLALDAGNPKRAYQLVEDAGTLGENPAKQQAFLAGWLALRYLDDTKAALRHFKAMKAAADGPLSRSKAGYWLGRAEEAAGNSAAAADAYRFASAERDTFHAHLSQLKLAPKDRRIEIPSPAVPNPQDQQRFAGRDAVRAALMAHRAGLGRSITRPFWANLRTRTSNEAELALLLHVVRALGDTQLSIQIAKRAIGDGHNVLYYSYPVHAFPKYTPLTQPPETPFLLGVARQETEFEASIVSGAGARGILQVMPITMRHVCNDYKLKCSVDRLLTDESYNTKIASAYIADRMNEFSGSYVLGLSGYNAGPGRTRQWIRRFGDPRDAGHNVLDWIERMPFEETRLYVTKVLSNIQMYRARLGGGDNALRLDLDLERGRRRERSDAASGRSGG